jgi:hypothetical protein
VPETEATPSEHWQALDRRLLVAHDDNDLLSLISLYKQAAVLAEADRDTTGMRFYLTQAMVYALDSGSDCVEEIRERLKENL